MPTNKPTLYLMLGMPGAGKTTAATLITELTGAHHLWADQLRRTMFGAPTYSEPENDQLYSRMNHEAAALLASGHSVVFDTSFNHQRDREHLYNIAKQANADVQLLWVTIDEATARERATNNAHQQATRALGDMSQADFERLRDKLEQPATDEPHITLDGTKISSDYLKQQLGL